MSVEESNERVDSASNVFALDEPVINLLFALLFIVVDGADLNVLSPARKVLPFLVPLSPRRAIATVPDERLVAFKLVKPEPLPENVVAVQTPVALSIYINLRHRILSFF